MILALLMAGEVSVAQGPGQLIHSTYLGGKAEEMGTDIELDTEGNMYFTGGSLSRDYPLTDVAPDRSRGGFSIAPVTKLSPEGSYVYSTFIEGETFAQGLAVDAGGNAFVVGGVNEDLNATPGAFDPTPNGERDAFVAKLGPSGDLEWATYLGGQFPDEATDVGLDAAGNVYVVGHTFSTDFPATESAYDITQGGGYDIFVSKLSSDGSALAYSTYLGGTGSEHGDFSLSVDTVIEVDSDGQAYVAGNTSSPDFPTTAGALDVELDRRDAFVAKLSTAGDRLVFSTFLGGNQVDGAADIDLDASGRVYVAGHTRSSDFPTTPSAFDRDLSQAQRSDGDGFVVQLSENAAELVYSTYLGGDDGDELSSIQVLEDQSVYVAGSGSINYPTTPDAFDAHALLTDTNAARPDPDPLGDVVVSRLSSDGSALEYSTFIGGTSYELARDLVVSGDDVFLTGYSESSNFPTTPGGVKPTAVEPGAHNMFLTRLSPAGSPCTHNGGNGADEVSGTQANDLICTGLGSDVIDAGGGNDIVYAQGGADSISGGRGYDVLLGGTGDDELMGDGGPDGLFGQAGDDELRVGGGEDDMFVGPSDLDQLLYGGGGADLLMGARTSDRIVGGPGRDVAQARGGRDRLKGGSGPDRLSGGDGPDQLAGGPGDDRLNGGNGRDRCSGDQGRNLVFRCER
jgi:Ca2+-binding RTX toxin-like protein